MRVYPLVRGIVLSIIFGLLLPACDQGENAASENQSRWQSIVAKDSTGESGKVQLLIEAVARSSSQKDRGVLVVSCERGTTDVYIIWHRYLGIYDPAVTWRVGSDPGETETWSLSTDNEATFAPKPVDLIKRMMTNDLFLVKTTPFSSSPLTMEFNTAGLKSEITKLREMCGWQTGI